MKTPFDQLVGEGRGSVTGPGPAPPHRVGRRRGLAHPIASGLRRVRGLLWALAPLIPLAGLPGTAFTGEADGDARDLFADRVSEAPVLTETFERFEAGATAAVDAAGEPVLPGELRFGGSDGPAGTGISTGRGLSLRGEDRILYRGPNALDPEEGALEVDLSLLIDPDEQEANIMIWSLVGSDGSGRRYMARLYLLPRGRLHFGVHDLGERVWLVMLKDQIRWSPGESHRVRVTWRDKIGLYVDGKLGATAPARGLLTEGFPPGSVDPADARLYVGPRSPLPGKQHSGFTIDRLEIWAHQHRYDRFATAPK